MLKTSIFPSRYVQGAGALDTLDAELARLGTRAACLVDRNVANLLEPSLARADKVTLQVRAVDAACTERAVADTADWIRSSGADIVVSFGGGKVIDTGRAAADDLRLPFVCVPTIAASDAPCSALAVIYDEAGRVVRDRFVRRNPDLVLLDTAVIVRAPARFFIAGIGDALATYYEADACRRAYARNLCGGRGTALAFEAARLCRDMLFAHAPQAVADCRAQLVTPDFDATLEATVLLSGIGFESGGVAAAHAIHHGLADLPSSHGLLHGEKVAIGVLASLFLSTVPDEERRRVFDFCHAVGLPTRLHQINVDVADTAALEIVAARACRAGEIIHNEPYPVEPAMVVAALKAMDTYAARFDSHHNTQDTE
ncbi:glycerol dehydrogenase [Paraburkholderia sp. Ac-20347]|uniref:glycerol dehydrogenase n=1 Tax=Paraburkholderia sp. Ac-20347 TaxID=2703892 RepID=UPI00197E13C0|nr:glycerol dehydrogenase [Paraburkholderia sp. Ac-20347]MBN3807799.1 glycerol dehydrogenase [Paraburkholderia sp. Ac-20347]